MNDIKHRVDAVANGIRRLPADSGRQKEPTGYIYAIRSGDFVKIGKTHSPRARVEAIRLHNPHPLLLVAFRSVANRYLGTFERMMHVALQDFRHSGEWFKVDSALVIEALGIVSAKINHLQRTDGRPAADWRPSPISDRNRANPFGIEREQKSRATPVGDRTE